MKNRRKGVLDLLITCTHSIVRGDEWPTWYRLRNLIVEVLLISDEGKTDSRGCVWGGGGRERKGGEKTEEKDF